MTDNQPKHQNGLESFPELVNWQPQPFAIPPALLQQQQGNCISASTAQGDDDAMALASSSASAHTPMDTPIGSPVLLSATLHQQPTANLTKRDGLASSMLNEDDSLPPSQARSNTAFSVINYTPEHLVALDKFAEPVNWQPQPFAIPPGFRRQQGEQIMGNTAHGDGNDPMALALSSVSGHTPTDTPMSSLPQPSTMQPPKATNLELRLKDTVSPKKKKVALSMLGENDSLPAVLDKALLKDSIDLELTTTPTGSLSRPSTTASLIATGFEPKLEDSLLLSKKKVALSMLGENDSLPAVSANNMMDFESSPVDKSFQTSMGSLPQPSTSLPGKARKLKDTILPKKKRLALSLLGEDDSLPGVLAKSHRTQDGMDWNSLPVSPHATVDTLMGSLPQLSTASSQKVPSFKPKRKGTVSQEKRKNLASSMHGEDDSLPPLPINTTPKRPSILYDPASPPFLQPTKQSFTASVQPDFAPQIPGLTLFYASLSPSTLKDSPASTPQHRTVTPLKSSIKSSPSTPHSGLKRRVTFSPSAFEGRSEQSLDGGGSGWVRTYTNPFAPEGEMKGAKERKKKRKRGLTGKSEKRNSRRKLSKNEDVVMEEHTEEDRNAPSDKDIDMEDAANNSDDSRETKIGGMRDDNDVTETHAYFEPTSPILMHFSEPPPKPLYHPGSHNPKSIPKSKKPKNEAKTPQASSIEQSPPRKLWNGDMSSTAATNQGIPMESGFNEDRRNWPERSLSAKLGLGQAYPEDSAKGRETTGRDSPQTFSPVLPWSAIPQLHNSSSSHGIKPSGSLDFNDYVRLNNPPLLRGGARDQTEEIIALENQKPRRKNPLDSPESQRIKQRHLEEVEKYRRQEADKKRIAEEAERERSEEQIRNKGSQSIVHELLTSDPIPQPSEPVYGTLDNQAERELEEPEIGRAYHGPDLDDLDTDARAVSGEVSRGGNEENRGTRPSLSGIEGLYSDDGRRSRSTTQKIGTNSAKIFRAPFQKDHQMIRQKETLRDAERTTNKDLDDGVLLEHDQDAFDQNLYEDDDQELPTPQANGRLQHPNSADFPQSHTKNADPESDEDFGFIFSDGGTFYGRNDDIPDEDSVDKEECGTQGSSQTYNNNEFEGVNQMDQGFEDDSGPFPSADGPSQELEELDRGRQGSEEQPIELSSDEDELAGAAAYPPQARAKSNPYDSDPDDYDVLAHEALNSLHVRNGVSNKETKEGKDNDKDKDGFQAQPNSSSSSSNLSILRSSQFQHLDIKSPCRRAKEPLSSPHSRPRPQQVAFDLTDTSPHSTPKERGVTVDLTEADSSPIQGPVRRSTRASRYTGSLSLDREIVTSSPGASQPPPNPRQQALQAVRARARARDPSPQPINKQLLDIDPNEAIHAARQARYKFALKNGLHQYDVEPDSEAYSSGDSDADIPAIMPMRKKLDERTARERRRSRRLERREAKERMEESRVERREYLQGKARVDAKKELARLREEKILRSAEKYGNGVKVVVELTPTKIPAAELSVVEEEVCKKPPPNYKESSTILSKTTTWVEKAGTRFVSYEVHPEGYPELVQIVERMDLGEFCDESEVRRFEDWVKESSREGGGEKVQRKWARDEELRKRGKEKK